MMDENTDLVCYSPDPELPPGSPTGSSEKENKEGGEEETSSSEDEMSEEDDDAALENVQPATLAAAPNFFLQTLSPSNIQSHLWREFQLLLDEARQLLLEAEAGQLCLQRIRNLSDRGMAMLQNVETLEIAKLDVYLMEILFHIFYLNLKHVQPDPNKFNFNKNEFARRI